MKALVVEDEMVVARHLSRILEEIGYTVPAMALTTEEALEMIDQYHPDIVLIDIVLKGEKDGIDLARRLRDDHNVPFLFITSHADRQTVRRAKATRPSGYVMKPFKRDEVYAATEIALSNHADEKNAPRPFDEKQPDLNWRNPDVREAVCDVVEWWLEKGIDGFRLDAVLYIDETNGQLQSTPATLDFWRDFNLHVKSVDADAVSVGATCTVRVGKANDTSTRRARRRMSSISRCCASTCAS